MNRNRGGRRCGFTLVEVILVLSILLLLSGLLLPVLGTVRQHAWETNCLSNLRQIGVALEVYRQQHDRLLPRATPLPSGDPYGLPDGLPGALRHILDPKNPVCFCPADHSSGSRDIGTSYFYVAGAFMMFQPPDPYPAARQVTNFFEGASGQSIPLVWDSEDRHFIGTDVPRNGLFIDGRTDRVGEPFVIGE